MTFILSPEAIRDLGDIDDYTTTQWGAEQAERYIRELYDAMASLAENPAAGRRRPDIPLPYLTLAVGSHLIIYRQGAAADRIEILNILHPAMDIGRRLTEALQRARQPRPPR